VASQCGIPLFAPSGGNSMSGMDAFLPGATCMGDLLARHGYHLTFMGGAPLGFAGKGKFYATHGFQEIAGRVELAPRLPDPTYLNAWGLYDDSLLDMAFTRYTELSAEKHPFALVLLTLDTHHPNGHQSAKCRSYPYGDGSNPILNAVHCSDRLLSEFVARIRNSPGGHDTVIAIASDHLAMRNSAYNRLLMQPRRNLFMVLDPRTEAASIDTPGSMLDIGATLMSFLGYDAQIGLGRDLRGEDRQSTRIVRSLATWGGPLSRFWNFPRIEREIAVDEESQMVRIDGRAFPVPLLIEVDAQLRTALHFPEEGESAMDLLHDVRAERSFVLVAGCALEDPRSPPPFCLFTGRGQEIRTRQALEGNTRFRASEIRAIAGARP